MCLSLGRIKASWIADTFSVGLRRVKQARQDLVAMGWLIPLASPQWAMNRWGALVRINLEWSRAGGIEPGSTAEGGESLVAAASADPELAPPPADSGAESAPPDSDKEPLAGR